MNNTFSSYSKLEKSANIGDFNAFLNHNESLQYRQNSKRLNLTNKQFNEFSITENGWNVDIYIHEICLVSVMDKSVNRDELGNLIVWNNIPDNQISNAIEKIINDNKLFNYYFPFHNTNFNSLRYEIGSTTFIEYNDEYLVVSIQTNQDWYCNFFLVYDKTLACKAYVVSYYSSSLNDSYSLLNFQGFSNQEYTVNPISFESRVINNYYYYYYYYYYQNKINELSLTYKDDNFNELNKKRYKNFQRSPQSHFETLEQIAQETDLNSYTYYKLFNEGNPSKPFDVYNETLREKVGTYTGIKDVFLKNEYRYTVNGKHIAQDMKLGHITGTINIQECFDENDEPIKTDFKIRVERTDRTHIGDYDVINGFYEVPQLDVNSRYNVFLIDEYGNMEWQVLSNRQPKAIGTQKEIDNKPIEHKVIWSNNINGYFVRVGKNTSYQDKVFYRNSDVSSSHTIVGKHSLIINPFIINHIEMNNSGQKLKSAELSVENIVPTDLRMV